MPSQNRTRLVPTENALDVPRNLYNHDKLQMCSLYIIHFPYLDFAGSSTLGPESDHVDA